MDQIYPFEKFYIYFSPHTAHALKIDGIIYPTIEHAYQCKRYTDQNIINEIINSTSPLKAWEISSKYKTQQIPEFKDDDYKLKIMKDLMILKVQQHKDVYNALIDSGNLKIVKHIFSFPSGDGFWDDGEDGKGLNHTGRLWMEIREEINNNII